MADGSSDRLANKGAMKRHALRAKLETLKVSQDALAETVVGLDGSHVEDARKARAALQKLKDEIGDLKNELRKDRDEAKAEMRAAISGLLAEAEGFWNEIAAVNGGEANARTVQMAAIVRELRAFLLRLERTGESKAENGLGYGYQYRA
jgi:hypothetical protein